MPLIESYKDQLKSSIADITNYGSRFGGSITAGLFLQHFIKDLSSTQFAHIDIAGPCWDDAMKNGGATGFGSKLVTEWIRRQGSS
jgi:leucyl aminopeptidase